MKETLKWSEAEIARWIQIIARPIFLVFGTIANSLSFYIMTRTSLKHVSSCFYMAVLAVADTGKYVGISLSRIVLFLAFVKKCS